MVAAGMCVALGAGPEPGSIGVGGDGAGVDSDGGAGIHQQQVLMLAEGRGDLAFRVEDAGATTSPAARFVRATKTSENDPVMSGYLVHSNIAVRAESREGLEAAIVRAGQRAGGAFTARVTTENAGGLPNVFIVEAKSVAQASELARLLRSDPAITRVEMDIEAPRRNMGLVNDPLFPMQWHLLNTVDGDADHNIVEAWQMGYSGWRQRIGILEAQPRAFSEGLPGEPQTVHPELTRAWRPGISMDVNSFLTNVRHGIGVAGIIAADTNNAMGTSGIAYNAQIVELRNGGLPSQLSAFSWKNGIIGVKNHSWGTQLNDVMQFIDLDMGLYNFLIFGIISEADFFFSSFLGETIQQGAEVGFGLKGVANVFSAGNGRTEFNTFERIKMGTLFALPSGDLGGIDSMGNFVIDGQIGEMGDRTEYHRFPGSMHTLAIGAVGDDNMIAPYSTTGTGVFVSAYSLGGDGTRGIVTLDQEDGIDVSGLGDGYRADFSSVLSPPGGTSAAAPIVSGIIALMREANPILSFRDIKHILKNTARPLNLDVTDNLYAWAGVPSVANPLIPASALTHWQYNPAETVHSDEYGFGVVDAEAAIEMAETWTTSTLPKQVILRREGTENNDTLPLDIADATLEEVSENFAVAGGLETQTIEFCSRYNIVVEEIRVILNVLGSAPGDLFIRLTSPEGTVSPISIPRIDNSSVMVDGMEYAYYDYAFTTYKHWGELAGGTWTIDITDMRPDEEIEVGEVDDETMEIIDYFTFFPALMLPGDPDGNEKTLESYIVEIYGYEIGAEPFRGCSDPTDTTCPHDLDADGIVTVADLLLFMDLWIAQDPAADWDRDGDWDYDDFLLFFQTWQPGPCDFNSTDDSDTDGEPARPPNNNGDDVRPL